MEISEEAQKKAHKECHQRLHEMLDELVADYISNNHGKLLSTTTILELIGWSFEQTINPVGSPIGCVKGEKF
jgi:hypothetical protein